MTKLLHKNTPVFDITFLKPGKKNHVEREKNHGEKTDEKDDG